MNNNKEPEKMQESQEIFFEKHNIVIGDDYIEVPEELEGRLNLKFGMLKRRVRAGRALICAAAAAVLMLVSCSVMVYVSPTARTFAEKIPLVGTLISNFYRDDSIEEAKKCGFIKVTDLVKEQDGFRLEVGELYFDGLRLSMDAKLSGIQLSQILSNERERHFSLSVDFIYTDKGKDEMGLVSETFKVREKNDRYLYTRVEKVFTEGELNELLKGSREPEVLLNYGVEEISWSGDVPKSKMVKEGKFNIPISLTGFAGIKKEENGIEYGFGSDFPAKSISIKNILSSPTLSQLIYRVDMKENMFFLGLCNAYVEDEQGKRFKGESGQFRFFTNENFIREGKDEFIKMGGQNSNSIKEADGSYKLNITPSLYNSSAKLKKLCFEGVNIMRRKSFPLDIKGSYPQYIDFGEKKIVINSAEYKDGELTLRIKNYEPDFQEFCVESMDGTSGMRGGGKGGRMQTSYDKKTGENVLVYSDNKSRQASLEKKDKFDLTVSAKYIVKGKVEIPLV